MFRTLPLIKNVIKKEITKLNENHDYWGTEENNDNENENYIFSIVTIEMKYNETIEEYYKRLLTY